MGLLSADSPVSVDSAGKPALAHATFGDFHPPSFGCTPANEFRNGILADKRIPRYHECFHKLFAR